MPTPLATPLQVAFDWIWTTFGESAVKGSLDWGWTAAKWKRAADRLGFFRDSRDRPICGGMVKQVVKNMIYW